MLTVDDIKKLISVFVTREELEEKIEKLVTKSEWRQSMTLLDRVLGELKKIREEQASHFQA